MAGHVFISYDRKNAAAYVLALVAHLEEAGLPVWFDGRIRPGVRWDREIRDNIASCAALALVMTPAVESSDWVLEEIDEAKALGKPILPLLLEGTPIFGFRRLEYEDVTGRQMPRPQWLAHLGGLLGVGGPARAPEPAPAAQLPPVTELTGTTWSGPDSEGVPYTFRFLPGGRLEYTSRTGTFTTATWKLAGDRLTMSMNDGYSTYEGVLSGARISGTARNVTGRQWTWSVRRK